MVEGWISHPTFYFLRVERSDCIIPGLWCSACDIAWNDCLIMCLRSVSLGVSGLPDGGGVRVGAGEV